MKESYSGLFSGMTLAVVLVFLLLVINFQSWIDPLIVLSAVPFALGGAIWMLFLSQTHISVPALMGTLMCIGLTTANSILVVTFANQRSTRGVDARTAAIEAGYTRLLAVVVAYIALYKALGGGWELYQEIPPIATPLPAEWPRSTHGTEHAP
jgi:multidrug efflux pump subunit AcrB